MINNSQLKCWSDAISKNLKKIHQLLREKDLRSAIELYQRLSHKIKEQAEQELIKEIEFINIIDASTNIGKENSQQDRTPRQAVIYAALSGWYGDDPLSWFSPVEKETLLAWAQSHYLGPDEDIEKALMALELQGLFFQIHPGVFENICYYCSFETDFLKELSDGKKYRELWKSFHERYDEEYGFTWRKTGLCAGQGSQGPSDAPWGPCLGTSCCWFKQHAEKCNHQLTFSKKLL